MQHFRNVLLLSSLRTLGPRWLRIAIQVVVDFIRGIPPLVPIPFIYFALPGFGLTLSEFWTGGVALSLIAACYIVEIVRASLESLDRGQTEAALSIGMTDAMALRFILLPQAVTRMLTRLIQYMQGFTDVWFATSAQVARHVTHLITTSTP